MGVFRSSRPLIWCVLTQRVFLICRKKGGLRLGLMLMCVCMTRVSHLP